MHEPVMQDPSWNAKKEGNPISQENVAGTLAYFSDRRGLSHTLVTVVACCLYYSDRRGLLPSLVTAVFS